MIITDEETFLTVQSLSSSDSVDKVDPSELWKTPKDHVRLGFPSRATGIWLEF